MNWIIASFSFRSNSFTNIVLSSCICNYFFISFLLPLINKWIASIVPHIFSPESLFNLFVYPSQWNLILLKHFVMSFRRVLFTNSSVSTLSYRLTKETHFISLISFLSYALVDQFSLPYIIDLSPVFCGSPGTCTTQSLEMIYF